MNLFECDGEGSLHVVSGPCFLRAGHSKVAVLQLSRLVGPVLPALCTPPLRTFRRHYDTVDPLFPHLTRRIVGYMPRCEERNYKTCEIR